MPEPDAPNPSAEATQVPWKTTVKGYYLASSISPYETMKVAPGTGRMVPANPDFSPVMARYLARLDEAVRRHPTRLFILCTFMAGGLGVGYMALQFLGFGLWMMATVCAFICLCSIIDAFYIVPSYPFASRIEAELGASSLRWNDGLEIGHLSLLNVNDVWLVTLESTDAPDQPHHCLLLLSDTANQRLAIDIDDDATRQKMLMALGQLRPRLKMMHARVNAATGAPIIADATAPATDAAI